MIAVSHSMGVISLYYAGTRHAVADSATILARANQALATLHRYRARLDEVTHSLSVQEIEDTTTLREALTVLQRLLMVRRIADEISGNVIELGTDGRLLGLQLEELLSGTEGLRETLIRDYLPNPDPGRPVEQIVASLDAFTDDELLNLSALSRELGYGTSDSLDEHVSPRGYRLLARIPRVPPAVMDRLIAHFETLQGVLSSTAADLQEVEGVGDARARVIREGLSRLIESTLTDRFTTVGI